MFNVLILSIQTNGVERGASVQLVAMIERPLCIQEVMGSIPGQFISKTLKMVPFALSLYAQHLETRARNQN